MSSNEASSGRFSRISATCCFGGSMSRFYALTRSSAQRTTHSAARPVPRASIRHPNLTKLKARKRRATSGPRRLLCGVGRPRPSSPRRSAGPCKTLAFLLNPRSFPIRADAENATGRLIERKHINSVERDRALGSNSIDGPLQGCLPAHNEDVSRDDLKGFVPSHGPIPELSDLITPAAYRVADRIFLRCRLSKVMEPRLSISRAPSRCIRANRRFNQRTGKHCDTSLLVKH